MADKRALRRLRAAIAALGVLAVILVSATGWLLFRPGGLLVSAETSVVEIGGPFSLIAQDGSRMTEADLAGAPFAVFFGFTHCPEVCPTTLWEMSGALEALGDDANAMKMLFITVDPERDTPEILGRYLQSFDPRIVGLTGTAEEIAAIANAYRAYWRKVPLEDGGYTMDHTASVYLMDAKGRFAGTISYEEDAPVRVEKLRRLARG